jgi:DnaK suppressor protein
LTILPLPLRCFALCSRPCEALSTRPPEERFSSHEQDPDEEKRDEIIKKAKQTLDEDMTLDQDDLPDEMDLASSEYLQSFTFRLRGREKTFLDKINKALVKIEEGGFGICEECEEEISPKRLEARPETNLCIRCKEDQERMEKDFA